MTSPQRYRFWFIGLLVSLGLLFLLRDVLLPFVAGMAIAYFLDPLADWLESRGLSRTASTAVITAAFFMTAMIGLLILVPILQNQIVSFARRVPGYIDILNQRLEPILSEIKGRMSEDDLERLRSSTTGFIGTAVSWFMKVLSGVVTSGLAVVNVLSVLFITPVVTFYMLRDWDVLVGKINDHLPRENMSTIRTQFQEIDRTLAGFIRGQATVCLCLGLFYGIGLSITGLDLGLSIGLLVGFLSFIPYVGTISGFVIGISMAIAQTLEWHLPVTVAGVFLVGQLLEGYVLTPKLVGARIGLHPVWIIFALLAGGSLFGFVGVLLAVPVAAVVGVLVRFSLRRYLESPLYHGEHSVVPPPL